jgi:hypothetical protein
MFIDQSHQLESTTLPNELSVESAKTKSMVELEKLHTLWQQSRLDSEMVPQSSEMPLAFPSNRPLERKTNVLRSLIERDDKKSTSLFSKRVHHRMQFNEKVKVMEEAARSKDGPETRSGREVSPAPSQARLNDNST